MNWERVLMNVLESICGIRRILTLLTFLCMGVAAAANGGEDALSNSVRTGTPTAASVRVAVYFERNEGQFPANVRFVARMPGYTAWFTPKELILTAGNDGTAIVFKYGLK